MGSRDGSRKTVMGRALAEYLNRLNRVANCPSIHPSIQQQSTRSILCISNQAKTNKKILAKMVPSCSNQNQLKLLAIQLLVLLVLCLLNAHAHRHRRHHHLLSGHHFVVKIALNECPVPAHCRPHVEKALLNQSRVPECDAIDYFDLLKCLDNGWNLRPNFILYCTNILQKSCHAPMLPT